MYRGTIVIGGQLKALTGLRIGRPAAMDVGEIDEAVVRDPVTGKPYIPGSSLKGKLRYLCERILGLPMRQVIPSSPAFPGGVSLHVCASREEYLQSGSPCPLCRVFGARGPAAEPTRLIVRDAVLADVLDPGDGRRLSWDEVDTEAPYAEVKAENMLDRLSSRSVPRLVERVPAGSIFEMELVYHVYDGYDADNLQLLLQGLAALTLDYLGASGTRGYGRVDVSDVKLELVTREAILGREAPVVLGGGRAFPDVRAVLGSWEAIRGELRWRLGV